LTHEVVLSRGSGKRTASRRQLAIFDRRSRPGHSWITCDELTFCLDPAAPRDIYNVLNQSELGQP